MFMYQVLFGLLAVVFSLAGNAQLQAYLNIKRFLSPQKGPYVETYILLENTSLTYIADSTTGELSCAAEIVQIFRQGEDIKAFDKYCLKGHSIGDSAITPLLDQQRFSLPAGSYTYELEIKDLNDPSTATFKYTEEVSLDSHEGKLGISDIELVEELKKAIETSPLTKSGYDMIPLVMNFYPKEFDKLVGYAEIYHSDTAFGADGAFLLKEYIESYETGKMFGDLIRHSREKAAGVVPVLSVFNISSLPSGNYNYVLEVRNRNNELVDMRKTFFQREGTIQEFNFAQLDEIDLNEATLLNSIPSDSLGYFILSLQPIATESEIPVIVKDMRKADDETRQRFFFAFWKKRNASEPQKEWDKYRQAVYKTNAAFGTSIRQGFETDRGRIYLKYGAPNSLMDRPNEPSTYPYQIWHYYQIGQFSDRRFIFYQPDLVTNDYELLHSNMRGEVQNYRWPTFLNSRNTPGDGSIDNPINGNWNHWGGNSGEYFLNPR